MVKKLKKMAESQKASPTRLLDNQLAQTVRDSAQQIWLAGMGAFAKAQAEGGKVFEALVSEGSKLQRRTQSVAEDRIQDMASKMTAVADGVTNKAGAQWDKLETIFEDRVARALNKLGVPSRADVDALIQRIDALSAQLGTAPAAKRSRVAKTAAAPVAAADQAVRKTVRKTARKVAASADAAVKAASPRRASRKKAA